MNKRIQTIFLFSSILLLFVIVSGQEDVKNSEPEDLTIPIAQHDELGQYVGEWNIDIEMPYGADTMRYSGSSTNRMLVNGRFLQVEFNAKNESGIIDGLFQIGYDRRNDEYQMTLMDSWGTYFVTAKGIRDAESGTIKVYGKDNDPMMKKMGFDKEFAFALSLTDKKSFSVVVYWIDNRTSKRIEIVGLTYRFTRSE